MRTLFEVGSFTFMHFYDKILIFIDVFAPGVSVLELLFPEVMGSFSSEETSQLRKVWDTS